jgi:hypothetical protein
VPFFDFFAITASVECSSLIAMTSLEEIHLPLIHLRLTDGHDPHQWVYRLLSSISSQRIRIIEILLDIHYDILETESSDNEGEDPTDYLATTMYRQLDRIDWRRIDQLLVGIYDRSSLLQVVVSMKLVDSDFPVAQRSMNKLLPNCFSRGLGLDVRLWRTNDRTLEG